MLAKRVELYRDHSIVLYAISFCIFAILLVLRESEAYGHIYNVLPVMGRTTPYVVLTLLVTVIYKLSGHSLRDIGLAWPQWGLTRRKTIALLLFAAILILGARILLTVPASWISEQLSLPPRLTRPTDILAGNLTLLLSLLPVMWFAVVSEEVLIRGMLMNALVNRFGDTVKGWLLAILLSSVIFGLGHFSHGLGGIISSGLGGLVYGLGYYFTGRNLLPVIFAHAAGNTLAFVGAYFNE